MPANVRIRDRFGVAEISNIGLGVGLAGVAGFPRQLSAVNAGDRSATDLTIQVVADPVVQNTSGSPVLLAIPNGALTTAGVYALTFSEVALQKYASVNGSAPIAITANGVAENTNLIAGLGIIFSAALAISDTATVTLNDGHKYTQVAPHDTVNNVPGTFATQLTIGDLVPNSDIFTNVTAQNVTGTTSFLVGSQLYAYALVGIFPDGSVGTPERVSATPAGSGDSKNVISWDGAVAGLNEIRVFVGASAFNEKLIAVLPPTATSFEDQLGLCSLHGSGPLPDWLISAEGLNPLSSYSATDLSGTGPVTYNPANMSIESNRFVGQSINPLSGAVSVRATTLDALQGNIQIALAPTGASVQLLRFGSSNSSVVGALVLQLVGTTLNVSVYSSNNNITTTLGGYQVGASMPTIATNQRCLITVSWDAQDGTVVFFNGDPVYAIPGLTTLVFDRNPGDNTPVLQVGFGTFFDDVAGDTALPDSGDLEAKAGILARANTEGASIFNAPGAGTAQRKNFWIRQSVPLGVQATAATRTFRLRASGNTL